MNGSASAPSSATMNATRCAINPLMKCTSRDRRSSFATRIGHFCFRACASAAASCGRSEVQEYQVQIRDKVREEREARTSGVDFTRFDIRTEDEQHPAMWKRNAISDLQASLR